MSQGQKVFPTNCTFSLSDDIRQEIGGKFTLMGYMPGFTLKLGPKAADSALPEALQSLAILMLFLDGQGTFNLKISLITPSGKDVYKDSPARRVDKLPNGPMNIHLVMKPFPIEMGDYKLTAFLDEHEYKCSFTITRD